jgi:rhamnose utilization protein RhaD (predicted bifunctional aldolase and dehydrogenase)
MNPGESTTAKQVKAFCARVGTDPLLVQGAGGNVSWKEGDVLWVKASGTWLVEAESRDIFVPVDLKALRSAAVAGNFDIKPMGLDSSGLRPSIEVMLHALMDATVVVHLHPIEILAQMVRPEVKGILESRVGQSMRWCHVRYFKPGAELARAVAETIRAAGQPDVVFMSNHGVVVAGENIANVEATLAILNARLRNERASVLLAAPAASEDQGRFPDYAQAADSGVHQLALSEHLFDRLQKDWALYPDHVVFLGAQPWALERGQRLLGPNPDVEPPPYIFVRGVGVFESSRVTAGQRAQLRCYLDVLERVSPGERLVSLGAAEVADLLGWESEKYRQAMSLTPRAVPGSAPIAPW